MDRYTYIHNKIWVDEKFNSLDQDSKMLVFYIFTSPHCNMIGYYRLPLLYAAADLGMEPERVKQAFEQVSDAGMVLYDPASSVVLVPNFLKYNRLQNANQAKGACALVEKLPENCLLQAFLGCVSEYAPQLVDAFASLGNGLPNGYPNGSPNPSETVTQTVTPTVTPYTEYRVQSTEIQDKESSSDDDGDVQATEPKFGEGSQEYELAVRLRERILANLPGARVPEPTPRAMQKWSQHIDRMIRLDKRSPDQIAAVIDWCQDHDFWRANILSPDKLRKQWETLVLQMRRGGQNRGDPKPGRSLYSEYDEH